MDSTKKFVLNYNDIPVMPNVMAKALNIIKDQDMGINDLAGVMSYDQALTTQVLKLVNSAYYGFAQQITSINKALPLLGMDNAKNIIITFAMKPMLTTRGSKTLWQHSIKTAVGCEILAREMNLMEPSEAFVVGFLHDIGKLVLNMKNPIVHRKVAEMVARGADILEAEEMLFGSNHCEVGFLLAKKWQLPIMVINGIKYHHNPQASSMSNLAYIVYVADKLVKDDFDTNYFAPEIIEHCPINISEASLWREYILNRAGILLASLSV